MGNPKLPQRCAVAACWTLLATCARAATPEDLSTLDLNTLMQMDVTLVTAQKRTENVNHVPISMTVLKADGVERVGLDTSGDLQFAAPGLTTSSTVGLMLPYIRGVGTDINSSGIEPSVAVYVDGIYQAERAQTLVDLFDVERVEVLRGPQGTLYGRNATGGAINITTRGPTDRLESTMQLGAGNLNLRDGSMFLAGPINERVRASLSAHARTKDSYYDNVLDAHEDDAENFYSVHGRAQLQVSPTLDAEVLLKYFSRDDSPGYGTEVSGNSIPAQLGIPVSTRPYQMTSDMVDAGNRQDSTTAALKLNWESPAVRIQSITSHNEQRHRFGADLDLSAASLLHVAVEEQARSFTQELQITPAGEPRRVDWLLGIFFIDSAAGFRPVTVDTVLPSVGAITQILTGDVETEAYAAFGEATLALTEAFSLTGGVRYSYEEKSLVDAAAGLQGAPLFSFPNRSHHWDDMSYRLVAKYTHGQSMLYAKTESGFKSGAYNNASPSDPGPVAPEQITAYEVGMKTGVAGLPVRIGAAAFFNDYEDLQIQIVDTMSGVTLLVQAPAAETYGADLSVDVKASEHWNIGAGLTWLHAQYREFVSSGVLVPNPSGGHTPAPDLNMAGNNLSRSPALTANLTASFDYPLAAGSLFGAANYYRSSRIYFDPANAYSQDAFGVLNTRVGYRTHSGWSVAAWAKNLTDESYLLTVIPGQLSAFGQYAEPRTYGVTVTYSFAK